MHQYQRFPERIMRGAYIPVAAADDLTGLLLRLKALMSETQMETLGPIRLENGAWFDDTELALKVVLSDVDHLLDLADLNHRQVSAARWQQTTDDLRSIVMSIAARV